ncbi:alpha/beta-hydrolase [Linderina pennispora]|uniref:Alpha/beta-hydrolase n=1 Tax=Linderina pennispora TaxID=61395 RepID=A0A1Y1W0J2_9FUNG|nr:alpha/beta-hydrolase [Linderina pennispora]ORX67029.1 alpha/beta-hydrolase [Linderina pennispora]
MLARALSLLWKKPVACAKAFATVSSMILLTTFKYIFQGPPVASWTLKTNLIRDFIRLIVLDLTSVGSFDSGQRVAKLDGGIATRFDIPSVPWRDKHLDNSGIWRDKLVEIAAASMERQMNGECVIADEAMLPNTDVLLHFHGGAYVLGTMDSYRKMHLILSKATGLPVYGFAYRLAPASQYPTQLYDAFCAFEYLRSMGVREQDIIFSGDSAGGNLALSLWLLLKPNISGMVLLSPRVDVTSNRDSWRRNAKADYLAPYNVYNTSNCIRLLLGPSRPVDAEMLSWLSDPFVASVHADFTGLPPTLVQAGTVEAMYDDISAQTGQLRFQTYPDEVHVFQGFPGMAHTQQALDAIWGFVQSLQAP